MIDLHAILGDKHDETMAVAESAAIDALNRARLHGLGWDEMASGAAAAALAAVLPDLLVPAWDKGHCRGKADAALNAVRVDGPPVQSINPYLQEQ